MHFPMVKAENLNGRTFHLPGDLEGEVNLLLLAFERYHQSAVDSWLPVAERWARQFPTFRYYEVPVVQKRGPLFRWWVDSFMRQGIPDPHTRALTITLYVELARFLQKAGLPDARRIYPMLVNPAGEVLWWGSGPRRAEVEDGLSAALTRLLMHGPRLEQRAGQMALDEKAQMRKPR